MILYKNRIIQKLVTALNVTVGAVFFLCSLSIIDVPAQVHSKQVSTISIEEEYFKGDFIKADSLLSTCGNSAACTKLKGISLYHRQAVVSAEASLNESLDQFKGKDKIEEASIHEWLGHLFMKRREPDLALTHYQAALAIHEQQPAVSGYSLFYLNYFLASAYYLDGIQAEERKSKPFIQIKISRADKALTITKTDSLIASHISKAVEGITANPEKRYYQYTLLFTEFPALPINPQYYEQLLSKLDETLLPIIKKEPIGITLTAQAAFWYLGYYQNLLDTYGKQIPVVFQRTTTSAFALQNFSKKGKENLKGAEENTRRLQQHRDLKSFLTSLTEIQQLIPDRFSPSHPALLEFRNEVILRLTELGDRYHEIHRYVYGEHESKKKRLDEAKQSNQPEKLNQLDPGLVEDLDSYRQYLKNKTFSIDSMAISLAQKNLRVLDNSVGESVSKNPLKVTSNVFNSSIHAASNTLLVKAKFLHDRTKRMGVMENEMAEKYQRAPFNLISTAGSITSVDVVRAFNENSIKSWKSYELIYDDILNTLENSMDKLYWASQSRAYRLDALDAAMLYAPRNAKGVAELNKLSDAFYFSERMRGTAFLSELASTRQKSGSQTESNYSRFTKTPALSDVQQLLDDKTAILWWVTTESNLYRFLLSKEQCKVSVTLRKEAKLLPLIKAFRNSILFQHDEIFRETAHTLYSRLFPQINKEITSLIIVPEKEMSLIPFEALLTDKVGRKEAGQYAQYPYLLNQYVVSYDLSLTNFWLRNQWQRPSQTDFVAFAPIFMEDVKVTDASIQAVKTATGNSEDSEKRNVIVRGNGVTPLPGTKTEVQSIDSLFRSKGLLASSFLFSKAGEKSVKAQSIKSSSIIHFATHGFADPYDPSASGLILAEVPTDQEDGVLYGFEVLELKLPAQLIVLSACETGLGKVFPGEGSVSLTRNFMLAGANNVVSSLWQVSDVSTQKLMVNFYERLVQNTSLNYSLALSDAKKKLVKEGFAHPYYWSAFLLHGR